MRAFNPESTTFTNLALDRIMPRVSPNAWKVLCLAVRKTEGWRDTSTESGRKESDIISISQFMEYCSMSKPTAVKSINECVKKGYLLREHESHSFRYRLNLEYELPDEEFNNFTLKSKENELLRVKNLDTQTVSVNSNINPKVINAQQILQETNQSALEENEMRTKEEIEQGNEDALFRSFSNQQNGYAHFGENERPWVQRFCELWNLRPPMRKSKDFSFWVTGVRELQDACGEYGVDLLDEVYADWRAEFQGGLCPFRVGNPNSLVKTARGKAGMKRQGISGVIKQGKQTQNRLGV